MTDLISISPADGTTNVPVDANIVLTFDKPVKAGIGTIDIYEVNVGLIASVSIDDTSQVTISGATVTINLPNDLDLMAGYTVQFSSRLVTDLSGDPDWSGARFGFDTGRPPDVTPPVLVGTSPADNSTGVGVIYPITLNFSEPVKAGTGNIVVHNADGSVFESVPITDSNQVTVGGYSVEINLQHYLAGGSSYYVTVDPGALTDEAGNAFTGLTTPTDLNFTTAVLPPDNTPPTVLSFTPSDNATNVPFNWGLGFQFSEFVQPGSGNIVLHAADGTVIETFSVTDPTEVGFNGELVGVHPSVWMSPGQSYYITVDAGAILDISGNAFAGITSSTTFNFTVTSTTPIGGELIIPQGTTVQFPNDTAPIAYDLIDQTGQVTGAVAPDLTIAGTVKVEKTANGATAVGIGHEYGGLFDGSLVWVKDTGALIVSAPAYTPPGTYTAAAGGTAAAFESGSWSADFTNDGLVQVTGGLNAIGVASYDPTFAFTNTGTFKVTASYSASGYTDGNGGSFYNSGDFIISGGSGGATGVTIQSWDYSFYNSGTISVTATGGISYGVSYAHLDFFQATFTNTGLIEATYAFYETHPYSPAGNPSDIINNSGTIRGQIYVGYGDDQIHNTGEIDGNVDLGTGNDLFDGATGILKGNISGGSGNDIIHAGAGDNILNGGTGDDTLDGGAGNDSADFSDDTGGVTASLVTGTSTGSLAGNDTLIAIENLIGGAGNDTLTGDDGANILYGNAGNDTLNGGGGNDRLFGGAGNDALNGGDGSDIADYTGEAGAVIASLTSGTATGATSGNDTLTGIEHLIGGSGNDTLTGDGGGNILVGGSGNDTLIGLAGDDYLSGEIGDDTLRGGAGNDTLNGGAGSDTADYSDDTAGVVASLLTGKATGPAIGTDSLITIENLTGGAGNDTLTGDGNANVLTAGAGNDILSGGGGDDRLVFASGSFTAADRVDGGAGNDILSLSGGANIALTTTIMSNVEKIVLGAGSYTLSTADAVVAASQSFVVDGSASTSFNFDGSSETNGQFGLLGGTGNDTLKGGAIADLFVLSSGGDDTVSGGGGDDGFIFGAAFTANDKVDGGTGNDTINLSGNYSAGIVFGASTITNVEVITLSAGNSYTLTTNDGNVASGQTLKIDGSTLGSASELTFNGAAETNGKFILLGGAGDDTLTGGHGNDTINGGAGNDTVDYSNDTAGVSVNLNTGVATGSAIGTDSLVSIENVAGGSGNDTLTGDGNANYMLAGAGNDTLSGGNGDDGFVFLSGTFTAADHVDGGAGVDVVYISGGANVAMSASTLANVEGILLDVGNYTLTTVNATVASGQGLVVDGSASTSISFDGSSETNGLFVLYGGAGNDTLKGGSIGDVFYLTTGGNDTLSGGGGDDTFYFGAALTASDRIDGGAGTDTINLAGDYSAGVTFGASTITNVESIVLSAGNNYALTSNDATVASGQTLKVDGSTLGGTNTLNFNGAAETNGKFVMLGGAGGDTLTGGTGNDTFTGGLGADNINLGQGTSFGNDTLIYHTAAESTGGSVDNITYFNFGSDRFDLPTTVTGIDASVTTGTLNAANFDANLATTFDAAHLLAGHAALYTPSAGDLGSQTYLVVDANGIAGYQAGQDYVFHLVSSAGTLQTSTFV